jgi:AcrR family transcriptional regulator
MALPRLPAAGMCRLRRRGTGSTADLPSSGREIQAAILDAAAKCFAVRGITATSMGAIAREAGISRAWLYRNYASRDATCERWDDDQAEKYVREIQRAIERVVANPMIGRACDEVHPGYRKHAVGSHTLY